MIEDKVFIDTNIWIYGLTESKLKSDYNKRKISLLTLEKLLEQQKQIYISIQIVNECHWNLVRKFKLSDIVVEETIKKGMLKITNVLGLNLNTYTQANELRKIYNFSFWDSLVIASALESNCSILYTEDMQDGQIIQNRLKIINPFIE